MNKQQQADSGHGEPASQAPAATRCLGVRGAITAASNSREEILAASKELVETLIALNSIDDDDIAAAFFTASEDLNAEYPALAARSLGWKDVAILCAREIDVPTGVPRVIRVLVLWNTDKARSDIRHAYLREAWQLRPDRANGDKPSEMPSAFQPAGAETVQKPGLSSADELRR